MPNIAVKIPLNFQLYNSDPTRFVRAVVRNSFNTIFATVNLPAVGSLGLYASNAQTFPNMNPVTAQYFTYLDSGYTTIDPNQGAGLDVFNVDTLKVGQGVPLYFQLFDYDATKYIRAILRDADGVQFAVQDLAPIGSQGLYANNSAIMVDTDSITAQYTVYDDAGYTTISGSEGAGLNVFRLDSIPFVQPGIRSSSVPNMSTTLLQWFQPMTFTLIAKQNVNFLVEETPTNYSFRGVWQPFSDQQLLIKPEGQRAWSWFMLHSDVTLKLDPDDAVIYNGIRYRVMGKRDYTEYQYLEYHIILDYQGDLNQ